MIIEASEFKLLYKDNADYAMNCETYEFRESAELRYYELYEKYEYIELIEEVKSAYSLMKKGELLDGN